MIHTTIIRDESAPPWPDLNDGREIHHIRSGFRMAFIEHGTVAGRTSVGIAADLDDGSVVVLEATLAEFRAALNVANGALNA